MEQELPNDDNQLALSKFESMLKTNNVYFFDSSEFEEITHYYLDYGKISLASKALKLGLEQHPSSVTLKLIYVELLILKDNFEKAKELLNELERIEPSNEEIYIQRAFIFSKNNQHKEAIYFLEKALLFTDDEVETWSMIGMEYLYLEDFEAARLSFAKCLDVEYDDYSSLHNMIYCYDMLNKNDEAINYLKKYIDKEPYCEVAWHQLGRQHFIKKEYEAALEAFDYAVIIDEKFVGAYIEKAKTLENLLRFKEAIQNYEITLKLSDPSSVTMLRIGECYEKIDDFNSAVKYFKLTVHEDPLLDKGWIALTDLYFSKNDFQKALKFIKMALKIDEENSLYWRKYCQVTLNLNMFEEATIGFKKCVELKDNSLDIWLGYADVLFYLGENNDALEVLQKASTIVENTCEIKYRQACLLFSMHKFKVAKQLLSEAIADDYKYIEEMKVVFPNVFKMKEMVLFLKKITI